MMEPKWPRILQVQLLQPIVHPLCRAVQAFGSITVVSDQIASLQSQAKLLDALETTLRRLPAVVGEEMQATITDKERQSLSKFLSLPLRGILRSYHPFVVDNNKTRSAPLQSALWKTVAGASRALLVLLDEWLRREKVLLVPLHEKVQAIELQAFLSVLLEALPDANYIEVGMLGNRTRALDTGHACIESTLRTVRTLLSVMSTTATVPWPCVVRLLSTTIALVEPPTKANTNEEVPSVPTSTQQESLQLMHLLLRDAVGSSSTEQLRSVFPAVYSGLFRRIVFSLPLLQTRQQHQTVVKVSIQCLAQLLEKTLFCSYVAGSGPKMVDMQQWLAFAEQNVENAEDNDEFLQSISEYDREFFRQIRLRIPNTLVELVGKLQVANTAHVRHATVHLLQAILQADHRVWGSDSKIPLTLLEAMMVLSQDTNESTVAEAMSSLRGFATDHITSRAIKGWIRERLFAVLEQLVVVARSANKLDLDQTLKLLQGYLSVVVHPQHRRDFQAGFASEKASTLLRRAFGTLWDVDFGPTQTMVVSGDPHASSLRHLRYVHSSDTADLLETVVQSFGERLGVKRSTLLIDVYISGMYKSAVDRAERGVSFTGESQIQWLHEWIGTLAVVSGLLRGTATLGRFHRMLSKLFRFVVPLLTRPPLWTSSLVVHTQSPVGLQTTNGIPNLMQIENSSNSQAFRGNCLFRCALLDCMGTFVQCLGVEAQSVAVELLPIVLECSSGGETMEIKNSASVLLETLARDGCGLPSVAEFVVHHTETTLIPFFRSKIRSAGGVSVTRNSIDVDELSRVVLSATKMLEIAIPLIHDATVSSQGTVRHLRSIVSDFSTRFDYLACKDEEDGLVATHFLRLFRSMVEYIHDARRSSIIVAGLGNKIQKQGDEDPWFALLDDFRTDQNQEQSFVNDTDSANGYEAKTPVCTRTSLVDEVASDATFISNISWRCCYLLSHSNLKVQFLCCQVLGKCFEFLGWVATLDAFNSENANGPRTAILRQITSCWQTLSKKLTSLSSAVPSSPRSPILVVPTVGQRLPVVHSDDESRVFLLSLLDLLQVIIRVSDDFMASRLKEIVVPVVQTLLVKLGAKQSFTSRSEDSGAPGQRTQSDLRLLLATIGLIDGIFSNRATGLPLSGFIPSLGSSLIPFLQDADPSVISATSDALKSLILIDGDSLYSLLLGSSGVALGVRPWEELIHIPSSKGFDLNSEAAKHLLKYLEELPEKPIW